MGEVALETTKVELFEAEPLVEDFAEASRGDVAAVRQI